MPWRSECAYSIYFYIQVIYGSIVNLGSRAYGTQHSLNIKASYTYIIMFQKSIQIMKISSS
jgi:hypothetical protein